MDLKNYSALYEEERISKIRDAILSNDRDSILKARKSLQFFFRAPMDVQKLGGVEKIRAQFFTTKSDIPEVFTSVFDSFHKFQNYDNRYEASYKVRTFDADKGYFTIVDTQDFMQLEEIAEGGKVKISRLSGTKADVYAKTYGLGIGWTRDMLEDRRFSEMLDMAETMREKYFLGKSLIHYGLLVDAANAQAGITWQGSGTTPADVLKRDMDTIMLTANTVRKDCKDSGFGDTATAPLIIYGSPLRQGRIMSALQNNQVSLINPLMINPGQITFYPTWNLKSTAGVQYTDDEFLMVLPGNKIQRGDKVLPTMESDSEITSFSYITTLRSRFAAGIGEVKQIRKFSLA